MRAYCVGLWLLKGDKAVNTATIVAFGWAGEVIKKAGQIRHIRRIGVARIKTHYFTMTDRQTN